MKKEYLATQGITLIASMHSCMHGYTIFMHAANIMYTLSTGPLLGTVTDFWRLVWQEGVQIIAMVTNTVEHGSVKCEKYWPESGISRLSGSIRITSEEESIFSDYVVRNFNLKVRLLYTE